MSPGLIGSAVPDSLATLAAKQWELMRGQRALMIFKGGGNRLPCPADMEELKLGPDIAQYNPRKTSPIMIHAAVRKGTLHDLLALRRTRRGWRGAG